MKAFDKCPVCGGELIEKEVEKLLRGGKNIAITHVKAEVCIQCGERLYGQDDIKKFEEIRLNLSKEETKEYLLLGQTYQVD